MLRNWSHLNGYHIAATDGELGKVSDFLFSDQNWTARYLVADTGYWLADRLVLISPHALREVDDAPKSLHVGLTRQQIEDSPPIATDQPVSRQFETEYFKYYGWPVYWAGPALWGPGPSPLFYAPLAENQSNQPDSSQMGDPNLRSLREIVGYQAHALDGDFGHVDDFVLDDRNWAIRYLVIKTGKWLPGRCIVIAPAWIQSVSWEQSTVSIDLPLEALQHGPEYDKNSPIDRAYEISLFQHYSRAGYWEENSATLKC